jgi:hypothetical protein
MGTKKAVVGNNGTILYYGGTPTLVDLYSFVATPSNREAILEWSTESEIDNVGFNIYRAESEDGNYIKINDSLIPAQGSPTQGASYTITSYSYFYADYTTVVTPLSNPIIASTDSVSGKFLVYIYAF